jgi:hypothetical protein
MSLPVKDGNGSLTALKTTLSASEHLPHHIVHGTVDTNISNVDIYTMYGGQALVTRVTASDSDPVHVTSSFLSPVSVTSSAGRELWVASSPGVPVYVSSSTGNFVQVTASANSPVSVTSSYDKPVYVTNDSLKPVYVTSSESSPVITKQKISTSTSRNTFSSFANTINWAGTGSSDISGTFILANTSSTRSGLMFSNNTNKDLYIALGDNDFASTNGFLLNSTSSAPLVYSFVLYPSGTYFAEPSFVNIKHSGFFISSSNIDVAITSYATE